MCAGFADNQFKGEEDKKLTAVCFELALDGTFATPGNLQRCARSDEKKSVELMQLHRELLASDQELLQDTPELVNTRMQEKRQEKQLNSPRRQ